MKKLILNNPKTSIIGLASAILAVLKYYHVVTTESSVLWLAVIGAGLGIFSKDGNSAKEVIINEVSRLPNIGNTGEWYHVEGDEYWYYSNGTWNKIIGGRPGDRP